MGYWMSTTEEGTVVVLSVLAAKSMWGGVAPRHRKKSWKDLSSVSAVPKDFFRLAARH